MKKQFLLLVATVFTSFASFAQYEQIPNGSFETWVDTTNPTGWATYATLQGSDYAALAAQVSGNGLATNGTYSLGVFTFTGTDTSGNPIGSFPGLVILGADGNGIAFTSKPDSLTFDYLYIPAVANDSAVITGLFSNAGTNINGFDEQTFGATDSQWVHKSLPVGANWTTAGTPDSLNFFITSSTDTLTEAAGAQLLVDNVKFVYNGAPTGIAAVNKDLNAIKMFPNPASSVVTVEIPAELDAQNITVVDMAGRAVKTVNNVAGKTAVNVDGLNSGNYLVTFTNAANKSFTGSKTLQVKK